MKKNREEAMRREKDEREKRGDEMPQTPRRGRGKPPKRHAPKSGKEAASEPVKQREETSQTLHRGRGRPPKRRALESDKKAVAETVEQRQKEEEPTAEPMEHQQQRQVEAPPMAESVKQQQLEEEAVEVEHIAVVPIGDPVTVSGRQGKKQKKHYASINDTMAELTTGVSQEETTDALARVRKPNLKWAGPEWDSVTVTGRRGKKQKKHYASINVTVAETATGVSQEETTGALARVRKPNMKWAGPEWLVK